MRFNGSITVDDGCVIALRDGKSVLAAGIIAAEGDFERGDIIQVLDVAGREVAKGLVEYDADDVEAIMGRQSAELEAILGHSPRSAVIHRDHLVLM